MGEDEDQEKSCERQPGWEAASEDSHGGCADDHSDSECRGEQARGSDGNIQVSGDTGEQAGEDEFRGALGEDRQGEKPDEYRDERAFRDSRKRTVRMALPESSGRERCSGFSGLPACRQPCSVCFGESHGGQGITGQLNPVVLPGVSTRPCDHWDQDPGNSARLMPTESAAATRTAAETPDPQ